MAEKNLLDYASRTNVKKMMTVKLMSFSQGFKEIKNVKVIQIKGKTNLLIMGDFLPMIGEIDGQLEFVSDDQLYSYPNVEGLFCHRSNEFTFLANEEDIW